MATTAVAIGKIELQVRKEQPIPEGWALGNDGAITTDAREAFDAGLLLPLGGLEVTSGYKGLHCALIPILYRTVLFADSFILLFFNVKVMVWVQWLIS